VGPFVGLKATIENPRRFGNPLPANTRSDDRSSARTTSPLHSAKLALMYPTSDVGDRKHNAESFVSAELGRTPLLKRSSPGPAKDLYYYRAVRSIAPTAKRIAQR